MYIHGTITIQILTFRVNLNIALCEPKHIVAVFGYVMSSNLAFMYIHPLCSDGIRLCVATGFFVVLCTSRHAFPCVYIARAA